MSKYMLSGIYINKNFKIGGEFSTGPKNIPLLHSVCRSIVESKSATPAIGIDLDSIKMEQLFIAETQEKKIHEIGALQLEYHNEGSKPDASWSNFIFEKGDKGTGLLVMITPAFDVPKKAYAYPVQAALYALAYKQGCIKTDMNSLILFFSGGLIMSLSCMGETIVFARRFSDNVRLAMNLKLSCQSVFFAKERQLIKPENVLVISGNADDFHKVEKVYGSEASVKHLDISGYFPGHDLSDLDRGHLALAYGVALAPQIPSLAHWNILGARKSQWKKTSRCLLRCIFLLLLALPIIFSAEILTNESLSREVDAKSEAIEPLFKRVSKTMSNIQQMKSFASHSGRHLIGPDVCFSLFSEIDKMRPNDLWLTSIAGNPYETISINGFVANYSMLLKFIENLSNSKKIKSSQLIFANMTEGGRVEFQIILKYKFAREFRQNKTDAEGAEQ